MKASDLITDCRRQLVETVGTFWSDLELLSLLNDAERNFNNKVRILQGKATAVTIPGQSAYSLPTNWLAEKVLFLNNPGTNGKDSWKRLIPTTIEKKAQENPNFLSSDPASEGVPSTFLVWSSTLVLDPTPDKAYSMVMFFQAKPVALTSTAQDCNLDDSFKEALEQFILWKAWKKEKEDQLAKAAQLEYLQGVRDGRRDMKKLQGDQRNRLDIESPYAFSQNGSGTAGFNPF